MAHKTVNMLQQSLPALIGRLGLSVADAQYALDRNVVELAREMADPRFGLQLDEDEPPVTLLELGFTPTFYQFSEATIDARLTFTMSVSHEVSVGARATAFSGLYCATVDASYTGKYAFDATASSAVTARLVSVPPPSMFNERLREVARKRGGETSTDEE